MNAPTHNTTVPLSRSCATVVNTNGLTVTAPSSPPPSPSPPASKKLKTPTKYLPSDVLEELMVFLGIAECCAIQATSIDFHKAIDFRLEKHCDPVVVPLDTKYVSKAVNISLWLQDKKKRSATTPIQMLSGIHSLHSSTYPGSNVLTLRRPIEIYGQGMELTTIAGDGGTILIETGEEGHEGGYVLHDFTLNMEILGKVDCKRDGIDIDGIGNTCVSIENVRVEQGLGDGFHFEGSRNLKLYGCESLNNEGEGFCIERRSCVQLHNCISYKNGLNGISCTQSHLDIYSNGTTKISGNGTMGQMWFGIEVTCQSTVRFYIAPYCRKTVSNMCSGNRGRRQWKKDRTSLMSIAPLPVKIDDQKKILPGVVKK